MIPGRRRTDVPDAFLRGTAADLSDHPTQAGRERSEQRRDGLLTRGADPVRRPAGRPDDGAVPREDARQLSRSRLPLPPVPAASRGPALAARVGSPAASLTTAVPFRTDPRPGAPSGHAAASAPPTGRRSPRSGSQAGLMAPSGPLVRVPRQTSVDGDSAYGDRTPVDATVRGASGRGAGNAVLAEPAGDLLVRPAPVTTAIPERSVPGARGRSVATVDEQAPDAAGDPRTGRAAMRAERQAADMARRKAVRRSGGPASALPDEDEVRKPRGIVKCLVAMAVVGLGVLGVYTWAAPVPQDAAAQSPSSSRTAPSTPPVSQLPPLPTEPVATEPTVAAPVRVPVTVLNATAIDGLAGKISTTVVGAGWEAAGVGAYEGDDVAVSTVFFTEGDENQRQAALQLIEQFPQLSGPAPRFFELPAEVTLPGLVVVAAGEWVP